MIVLKRITSSGKSVDLGIPLHNVVEASPHKEDETKSWVKYWDGKEVRSAVVVGTVLTIAGQVRAVRHNDHLPRLSLSC